jgi:hypothetical protein
MKKLMSLMIVAGLFLCAPAILVAEEEAPTNKEASATEKRAEIDKVAKEA